MEKIRLPKDKEKVLRLYDNGGKTLDRYTAVYMDQPEYKPGEYSARGMCTRPTSPQGFGCSTIAVPGRHLGKRIKFDDLPTECQKLVLLDLGIDLEEDHNGEQDVEGSLNRAIVGEMMLTVTSIMNTNGKTRPIRSIVKQVIDEVGIEPTSVLRRDFDGNSQADWLVEKMIGEFLINRQVNK